MVRKLSWFVAATEMPMGLVKGDQLVERRQLAVDNQVMVARVREVLARRRYSDVARAEPDPKLAPIDYLTVGRPNDVNPRILWRGRVAGNRHIATKAGCHESGGHEPR